VFLFTLLLLGANFSWADDRLIDFNIPAQPLDGALLMFAEQADIDVIGLSAELSKLTSPALMGLMIHTDALDALFQGTHLSYRVRRQQAVTITEKIPMVAPADEASSPEPAPILEEVIVSATRRNTNLQDTPIAVTAISSFELERNQVKDLRDIAHMVPGLEMINTAQQAAVLVQLRGVGSTNITEIADGPVAIHVDGVYSPRAQGAAALLFDVERIEVLRGPQGTLFGRNSASGSINIHNRQPSLDQLNADLSLSYGDYGHREARGMINIPVTDTLSMRLAGASNQRDAYTQLRANYAGLGPHYPAAFAQLNDYDKSLDFNQQGPESADQVSVRLSTLWKPSAQFSALVSLERYNDKSTGIAELDPTLVEQGIRAVVLDSPTFLNFTNDVLRSKIDYHFSSGLSLSYTFGWSDMSRQQIYDADHGRDGSFEQQRTHSSDFRFNSHELQLMNRDEERLRWVVGAFVSEEKNSIVFAVDQQNAGAGRGPIGASSWISDGAGAAVSYAVQPDRRVESLGLFAQAAYDLSDRSRFTWGARYTEDTKSDRDGRALACRVPSELGPYFDPSALAAGPPSAEQIYADAATAAAIAAGLPHDGGTSEGIGNEPCWVRQVNDFSATWKNTSGLLRYDLDLTNSAMLYSSVASGFKSGHIQDAGNSAKPETVINYELGLKSQFFDDQLRFNAALYRADYKDLQFSNQDRLDTNGDGVADSGGSTVVRNASEATIQGLELELEWAISPNDVVQLSGSMMRARFEKFEIPDTLFGNLFNPYTSSDAIDSTAPVTLSGNSPPRTPDWKLTLVYEHHFNLAAGSLTPRLSATLSDRYYLDIYNREDLPADIFPNLPNGGEGLGVQDRYQTYDISVRFSPWSQQWLAEAYVKNISDENIKVASGNFITEKGFSATYLPPRTYGIKFSYSFGG